MTIVTAGKRLISAEQIALIEPFDPASTPAVSYYREFKGRLLLLCRKFVLTEEAPSVFAEQHRCTMLQEDGVALNPKVEFKVERFEPTDKFTPARPFLTRLKWRDPDGAEQSKLLLTSPENVINKLAEPVVTKPAVGSRRRGSKRAESDAYASLAMSVIQPRFSKTFKTCKSPKTCSISPGTL
jgi:hypothetical protein